MTEVEQSPKGPQHLTMALTGLQLNGYLDGLITWSSELMKTAYGLSQMDKDFTQGQGLTLDESVVLTTAQSLVSFHAF